MAELMTIARPYANAAFAQAQAASQLAEMSDQLANLATIASDDAMASMMSSPGYTNENVLDVFVSVMGKGLTSEGKNLLTVMSENNRLSLLPLVSDAFENLKATAEKRVRATVTSARKVTVDQKKKLGSALDAKFDAKVEINYEVDASLISGVKIKVGDWAIDGSALAQLSKLGAVIAQ